MCKEMSTLSDKAWQAASNKNNWLTIGSHNLTSLSDEHVKSILSSGDHAQYDIPSVWPDSVAATSKVWSIMLDHVSIQKSKLSGQAFSVISLYSLSYPILHKSDLLIQTQDIVHRSRKRRTILHQSAFPKLELFGLESIVSLKSSYKVDENNWLQYMESSLTCHKRDQSIMGIFLLRYCGISSGLVAGQMPDIIEY